MFCIANIRALAELGQNLKKNYTPLREKSSQIASKVDNK